MGLGVLFALGAGWLIGTMGMVGGLIAVGVPVALIVVVGVLLEPRLGLFIYLNLSFMIGMSRFLPGESPVGLGLDGLLVLTLLATLLNGKRMDWKQLRQPAFWLLTVWVSFTMLEYFNPEHPYPAAWFYHIRSFSLSWFFVAIIVSVNPITRSDITLLVKTWLFWSFLAALWGFKQQYISLEPAELRWLAEGAEKQHILWGKLRSFSFYSDAGQFGSEMAGVALLCMMLFVEPNRWFYRLFYLLLGLLMFWGFAISGTRGALFVILAGFPAYFALKRDLGLILKGLGVALPIMAILLFTHLGDSNYQIWRIRSALRPTKDASFVVRLENQQKLQQHLKKLPFGAGIGTSSGAGQRFSPNHFASQIPTDSWYVQIWIETGIVGLSIYLTILVGFMLIGTLKIWQLKDRWVSRMMILLLAEFVGICLVSYTNPILGQFPTSTTIFINTFLFTTCHRWDSPALSAVATLRQKIAA